MSLRTKVLLMAVAALLLGLQWSTCHGPKEGPSHLLEIDTPDKGYLHLPVRITDRATAEAANFDPEKEGPASVSYHLTRDGLVRVRVVWRQDPGLVLRTLLDWSHQDFGRHILTWDGRDASGNLVNNKNTLITFEGDDPKHVAHAPDDCHELAVYIHSQGVVTAVESLPRLTAELGRQTSFGRKNGFLVRCYLDYRPWGQVRLDGSAERFFLPCDSQLEPGDHLLTINVEDGAGHVGVAGRQVRRENENTVSGGRALFVEKECELCHDVESSQWSEAGPGLRHIGSRRPQDYLRQFMRSPRSLHRTSLMPEIPLTDDELTRLFEYLLSLQRPAAPPRNGAAIYREEGCFDCHDRPGEFGAMAGPALAGIGRLRTVDYLEGVILDPKAWFPRTGMPPTLLPPQELSHLVDYLIEL